MQGILFGIITYISWGVGDIFGATASRRIDAYSTTFWVEATSLFLFTLYVPFVLADFAHFTPLLFIMTIIFGFLHLSGNVALNEAFTKTNPSLAGTINASFPALVIILSVLFLHESITLFQVLIIIIIFLGVFLCLFDFTLLKSGKRLIDRGSFYAFYAASAFAVYFTFLKLIAPTVGWFWPLYLSLFHWPLIYFYLKKQNKKLQIPMYKQALFPIVASAFLLRSGDFVFNYGLTHGLTNVVAPIAGAYPTLFAFLAFLVFKDPMKKQQLVGIGITLMGIVLLSALSF